MTLGQRTQRFAGACDAIGTQPGAKAWLQLSAPSLQLLVAHGTSLQAAGPGVQPNVLSQRATPLQKSVSSHSPSHGSLTHASVRG